MKELPTLPPATDDNEFESSSSADESSASRRPVLPVDAELEVSVPERDAHRSSKSTEALHASQKARLNSPFIIKGSFADGVDPLPVPPAND